MTNEFADKSFLFSLLGNDAHTPAAQQRWAQHARLPLTVTALGRYELGNALRFAAFRKAISQAEARASLAAFEADLKSGHLHQASCDLAAMVAETSHLSDRYTLSGGHRFFDPLHVAAARLLKMTPFSPLMLTNGSSRPLYG